MDLTMETITALSERRIKAAALVREGKVWPVTQFSTEVSTQPRFVIPDAQQSAVWEISIMPQRQCSCPDFKNRQALHEGFCKHVMAVLIYQDANPQIISAIRKQIANLGDFTVWDEGNNKFSVTTEGYQSNHLTAEAAIDCATDMRDHGQEEPDYPNHYHQCLDCQRIWPHREEQGINCPDAGKPNNETVNMRCSDCRKTADLYQP